MIIAITGKSNHGKDTLADYIVKKYKYTKISFASPIKEICKIIFGFTENQLYSSDKDKILPELNKTPREMLHYIGNDILKYKYDTDIWVKCLERILINNKNSNYVISDLRFINEYEMLKKYNTLIIKIQRNIINEINDIEEIDKIDYNELIINNDDKEELYKNFDIIYNKYYKQENKLEKKIKLKIIEPKIIKTEFKQLINIDDLNTMDKLYLKKCIFKYIFDNNLQNLDNKWTYNLNNNLLIYYKDKLSTLKDYRNFFIDFDFDSIYY